MMIGQGGEMNKQAMTNAAIAVMVRDLGWSVDGAVRQVRLYFAGHRDHRVSDDTLVVCSAMERGMGLQPTFRSISVRTGMDDYEVYMRQGEIEAIIDDAEAEVFDGSSVWMRDPELVGVVSGLRREGSR